MNKETMDHTTIGSETFGNGTKAAIEAEYAESCARVTACNLLKKPHIQDRIVEFHTENMQRNLITVDKVLADLEHDKLMARENKQFAVAKGCTELQGKYLAMFTDRLTTETDDDARKRNDRFKKHRGPRNSAGIGKIKTNCTLIDRVD
ncbi:terminase small subunit [Planctomycetota bacterium]